jgi:hypothetical protein
MDQENVDITAYPNDGQKVSFQALDSEFSLLPLVRSGYHTLDGSADVPDMPLPTDQSRVYVVGNERVSELSRSPHSR